MAPEAYLREVIARIGAHLLNRLHEFLPLNAAALVELGGAAHGHVNYVKATRAITVHNSRARLQKVTAQVQGLGGGLELELLWVRLDAVPLVRMTAHGLQGYQPTKEMSQVPLALFWASTTAAAGIRKSENLLLLSGELGFAPLWYQFHPEAVRFASGEVGIARHSFRIRRRGPS